MPAKDPKTVAFIPLLYGLVPLLDVPIPVFSLGLFTMGIQAVVFATLVAATLVTPWDTHFE